MAFPRAAAVAETGWTPEDRKSWSDFADRLPAELDRYRALGLGFDAPSLQPYGLAEPDGAGAKVTLAGGTGLGEIRYSLDGKPPTATSPVYDAPIAAKVPSTVTAALFRNGQVLAPPMTLRLDPLSIRTRVSQELKLCSGAIPIGLEDDAPIQGPRAVIMTDLMNPCWIYPAAPLDGAAAIEVAVAQLPFNFQIGDDIRKIVTQPPATPEGELVVRRDACDGPVLATLSLAPAVKSQGVTVLKATLPATDGRHDLCLTFTRKGPDPIWAVDRVSLILGRAKP